MSLYRKDNNGNIRKIASNIVQKIFDRYFTCTRTMEGDIEYYDVPSEFSNFSDTLRDYTAYIFKMNKPNTTVNPKLRFNNVVLNIVNSDGTELVIGQLKSTYQYIVSLQKNEISVLIGGKGSLGTIVTVGTETVDSLSFTSDPQGQLDDLNGNAVFYTSQSKDYSQQIQARKNINALGSTFFDFNGTVPDTPKTYIALGAELQEYPITLHFSAIVTITPDVGANTVEAIVNIPSFGKASIIQLQNSSPSLITQIIQDSQLIICLNTSEYNGYGLEVSYKIDSNSNDFDTYPTFEILNDYTPSDEAVVFDCTSTGFETDNIAANNIDTKFINGQPVSQIGGGISLVSSLPAPSQTEYNKHLLYLYAGNLEYLTEVIADEPVVTTPASLPMLARSTSTCAIGTDCYIFGGYYHITYYNTIIKFDSVSQTATTLSATLPNKMYDISACAVGTDCYIFGGRGSSSYLDTIIKFDSAAQTVTTLSAKLPEKMSSTSACAVGTDCYIFGGRIGDGNNHRDTIIKFDSVSQTATTLSAKLPNRTSSTSACAVGTNCYVFGGASDGYTYLDTIIKFDSAAQTVTTLSAKLPNEMSSTSACAVGTDCYIFGGNKYRDTIIKFDSVSQTATTLSAKLPNGMSGTSACAVGTNCYVFGGYTGSDTLNSIVQVAFGVTYTYKIIQTQ